MILGNKQEQELDEVYFIMLFGQSNADGRATAARLANVNWNYRGISTEYPASRTTQGVYSATPPNVYIYNKGNDSGFNTEPPDNGVWELLNAGVNNSKKGSLPVGYIGVELSLATLLQEYSGRDIYIVKAGFFSTYLVSLTSLASGPGTWQYTNRHIAMEFYLRRAVRDFRAANPNKRPMPLCVYWWQGENDAVEGRTADQYAADFTDMRAYMDGVIRECFVMDEGKDPLWIMSKLDFTQSAAEGVINTGITNYAASASNVLVVDPAPYPRRSDLTTAERLPNDGGSSDNNHSSYIAMLAMGEIAADLVIDHGVINHDV